MKYEVQHTGTIPFTMIPNKLANCPVLSSKAKGIYLFMFCKPPGWNFTTRSMAAQIADGRDAIMAGLNELKKHGWLTYQRHQNGTGTYFTHLEPRLENPTREDLPGIYPGRKIPPPEIPTAGKSHRISNTDLISKKDLSNKKDPVTTGINPVGDDLFNLNLSKEEETLNSEDLDQVRKDLEHLKNPEEPKEKSCAKKEKGMIDRTMQNFTDCFLISFGFNYSIKPQDYRFIKLIIQLYKQDNPGLNDQAVEASIKTMFGAFNKVKDTWLLKKMSPQIIYSEWNRFKSEMAGITETKKHYTYDQAAKIILDSGRVGETFELLFERIQPESGTAYYLKNY